MVPIAISAALAYSSAFSAQPVLPPDTGGSTVWLSALAPDDSFVSSNDGSAAAQRLVAWLATELPAEGYPVTQVRTDAQIELTVISLGAGVGYRVVASGQTHEQFDVAVSEDRAVVRLELLQRAVDALEAVEPWRTPTTVVSSQAVPAPKPPQPPAADDEVAPGLAATVTPRTRARLWPESALTVRGGVAVGVVSRSAAADLLIAASGYLGREPGVSGWLDVQVWPSFVDASLRIVEAVPAAGLRVRVLTRGRWSLDTGALLGVQLHRYSFTQTDVDSFSSGRGLAIDISTEAAVGASFRMGGRHEIQALLRVGQSGRSREHISQGTERWRRGAWRIGASLGVTFGIRVTQ